ncbi:hypothetical protein NA56DRAFT_698911 [Hyaloscypha hepaticicola]|uniref:Uncharacterized protein n=1 Tax=Hyaloscypha hepaticicola TaxID=2082293 RepID=A0A2J6QHV3_9HELO|nr:hypothetical protein NA56DRAFT_698911 [Hyaloscypha hepaticicola]
MSFAYAQEILLSHGDLDNEQKFPISRNPVSYKRPSFNDPNAWASVQLLLGALPISFIPTLTVLWVACHQPWRLPHIWPMPCVGHSMARLTGRHRAPTAPRRRAGIEEAVVPNLVSELQNRDDVEHVAS